MDQIGKYRVERLLGRGGFAAVWLCHDPDLDRRVAIKVLADIYSLDADIRRRFVQEARLLSRLEDERILRVHTIDTMEDGRPYFVADYADRGTLRDRIVEWSGADQPLAASEAIAVAARIGECLAVAHHHNVVHRDLKPTNVLYRSLPDHRRRQEKEALVLADFGIARALEGASRMAMLTTAAGTIPYMAPEQAQGLADTRCDIYAATVILYELLIGRAPFEGETDLAVLLKKQRMEFTPITSFRPGLSSDFDRFIERGLSPEREERIGTAEMFIDDLLSLPVPEVEDPPPRRDVDFEERQNGGRGSGTPTTPHTSPSPPEPQEDPERHHRREEPAPPPPTTPHPTPTGGIGRQGPGGPTSVPDHPGRGRAPDSRRRGLLVAAGAIVALVVTVLLTGGGTDEPEGVPPAETTVPDTDPTVGAEVDQAPGTTIAGPTLPDTTVASEDQPAGLLPGHMDVIDQLVFPEDESCEPATTADSEAGFAVSCPDDASAVTAVYSSWESPEGLEERQALHESATEGTSRQAWNLGNVRMGDRVEYVDGDGNAVLFWTYEAHSSGLLSGEATRADGDLEALRTWWTEVGRPLAEPPEPTPEEVALSETVGFAPNQCVAVRHGDDREELAIAQLSCTIRQDDVVFRMNRVLRWESVTDLQGYWARLEEGTGGERRAWDIGGVPRGGVLTFRAGGPDGPPAIAWSDDSEVFLVQGTTTGSAEDLQAWWETVRR